MPFKLHGEYYGTKEAAEVLGRTESRVAQMCRWGEIESVEISPRVRLIPKRAVDRILRDRVKVAS